MHVVLLIAPSGIEIAVMASPTLPVWVLLIAPSGIEISKNPTIGGTIWPF